MYAIIETGGKQHRVARGDNIKVDLLDAEEGGTVEIDRVLFASDGDKVMVGDPLIKGAKVIARVNNHGRGEKIIVFRYKNKVRYSNKLGHRQGFTSLTINEIELPEEKAKATKKTPKQKVEENQDGA